MTAYTIRLNSEQRAHLIRQASMKNTTKANIIRELINNQIKQQENE